MPRSVEQFVTRGFTTSDIGSRPDVAKAVGLNGLALAMGAILAAMRQVVQDLEQANGQRLVLIHEIRNERRHDTTDPRTDPPAYWPSKPSPRRRDTHRSR